MTATPESPSGNDDNYKLEFTRIVDANGLSELDALETSIETPNLDFIADYEAVIQALSLTRNKPTNEHSKILTTAANSSIVTLRVYITDILAQNQDAAPQVITKLLATTNNIRSVFLSEITNNTFDVLDDETTTLVEDGLTDKYETSNYDALIEVAVDIYKSNLEIDISKLLSIAIPEFSARASTKLLKAAHAIGRHALDISKIATGVATGIIIANKLRK